MKFTCAFFLIFTISACATGYKGNGPYKKVLESNSTSKEGIVFLSLLLKSDSNERLFVSYNTKIVAIGSIKETDEYSKKEDSRFLVQLLDAENRPLKDFYIEDVLNPVGEVLLENGSFEKFKNKLNEKEIFLRFNAIEEQISRAVLFELDSLGKEHFIGITDCK